MAGKLEGERLEAFLTGPNLARLGCVRADGSPMVVPVWYEWDGEALWFVGRARSAWCFHLESNPLAAAVIDVEGPVTVGRHDFLTPRVVIDGNAEIVERPGAGDRWVEIARSMARRYRGEPGVEYIESTRSEDRWLIRLVPTEIQTWEGGGWAARYRTQGG